MVSIYFVSTYKPILCGIADYLKFLLKEIPKEKWKVISFDLKSFQDSLGRLTHEKKESPKQVWYGITNRRAPSTSEILKGIKGTGKISRNIGIAPIHVIEHRKKLENLGLIVISNEKQKRGFTRIFYLTEKGEKIIKLLENDY